ncbi:MAG TPA: sigma-70 family RNA polymerase sigma factor [Gemmatimonadales bacterium]|jgi:RNA polymerase sigma factor (sigma-70 family)
MPAANPSELSTLLHAPTEAAREDAWAAFLRAYTDDILRVVRSLGGDHDLLMDRYTFVLDRLLEDDCRRLRGYARPGAGPFALWLVVVVRRLCLDHHRHRYGRSRESAPPEERAGRRRLADLVSDEMDTALLAAPTAAAPDAVLARSERARALAQAMEELPHRDRLLLRLRFSEDLPAREIARLMGFPTLFHVYRRLDKVLGALRGALEARSVREAEA